MSGKGRSAGCPACFTPIGWADLSHDGVLHGRTAAAGGPFFTILCPSCKEPLRAEGGVGRVYRFTSVRARSAGDSPWRRWLQVLFGAASRPANRSPHFRRSSRRDAGTRPTRPARPRLGARLIRLLGELELGPESTIDDVKARFRVLAKQTHPDTRAGASDEERERCRRRFIEVNRAYREIVQEWPRESSL